MKLGTYNYRHGNGARNMFDRLILTTYHMRVEVMSETAACYIVRFMEFHADGRGPNTRISVRKKSVDLDDAPAPVAAPPQNIRLPYKDNDND